MEILVSIDDVIQNYKKRIKKFIKQLNLDYPGLESVKNALDNKNLHSACEKILNYYQNKNYNSWEQFCDIYKEQILNTNDPKYIDNQIEDLEKDIFTFLNIRTKIPRLDNGHLNWEYTGPTQDKEFGWSFNRQHYLLLLCEAYKRDGNKKYSKLFNKIIQDWLISNPRPRKMVKTAQWRPLEVALRILMSWVPTFSGFQDAQEFYPATRLLMLASIPDHATYCKKYVVPKGNIRVMITNALGTIGGLWPEFKQSKNWVKNALNILLPEISSIQIYPDGAQKELTSHYHHVALKHFEHFTKILKISDIAIPETYQTQLENMWNYYAYCMRPNGYSALNNDTDYDHARPRIMKASKRYNRNDWNYVATNGNEGDLPQKTSVVFPWAGHIIMRNHFKSDADWTFFDFGPFGTGHQHRDRLHLSIRAHSRDFLVDSGRYRYINDEWRSYFKGSAAHNTILIDKYEQNKDIRQNLVPEPKDMYYIGQDFDFAVGRFYLGYDKLKESITHTRGVLYIKNEFWIIIDHITMKKKHKIQALWHFNPEIEILTENNQVFSIDDNKPNISSL